MKKISYASAVGSLMYAPQVCTRPDIAFVVNALRRYLSDLGLNHWKAVKEVFRYLQGTKDHMLTFRYFEFHADKCYMKTQDNKIVLQGIVRDGLYVFPPLHKNVLYSANNT